MLPFSERAFGINLMSALTGALASLFLYLITARILVLWRGVPQTVREKLVIYSASACSALAGAFSGSFWINSIEAEVYSPSAFIIALTVWLMIRWAQRYKEGGSRNSLVLICYLLGLSVGLHLAGCSECGGASRKGNQHCRGVLHLRCLGTEPPRLRTQGGPKSEHGFCNRAWRRTVTTGGGCR